MRKSPQMSAHLTCLLLLTGASAVRAAKPNQSPQLTDGVPFSARGQLQLRFRGWASFLILPLDRRFLAEFGGGEGERYVTTVELHSEGNGRLLAQHAEEIVEARGKLQLEGVSPYYWNGVMLMADTVKLEDGTMLRPQPYKPPILPSDVERYLVTVTMLPLRPYWPHEAVDLGTGKRLPDPDLDGCSLNGGGDVLNCFCADGFAPIRASVVSRVHLPGDWQLIPKPDLIDSGMAQFGLPDPDAKAPQIYQVVCERKRPPR